MRKRVALMCVGVVLAGVLWGQEDPAKKASALKEKEQVAGKKLGEEEIRRMKMDHSSYELGSAPAFNDHRVIREKETKKLKKE